MMWFYIQIMNLPKLWLNVGLRGKGKCLKETYINTYSMCCCSHSPECCCMWSNLRSQSTFTFTSWPSSKGEVTKCTASGPCLVTLNTGTSPMIPWSSGWKGTTQIPLNVCTGPVMNSGQEMKMRFPHLSASFRKQDGVLELHIKALQSLGLPVDLLLELSWTAGHNRRNKLEGKDQIMFIHRDFQVSSCARTTHAQDTRRSEP